MHLKISGNLLARSCCRLVVSLSPLRTRLRAPTVLVYHDDDGIKPPELASTDFSSVVLNQLHQYDERWNRSDISGRQPTGKI